MPFDSDNLRDGVITWDDIRDSQQEAEVELMAEQAVALVSTKLTHMHEQARYMHATVVTQHLGEINGMLEMAACLTNIDIEELRERAEKGAA